MTLAPGRALRLFADGASSSDSARQQRSHFREALRRGCPRCAFYCPCIPACFTTFPHLAVSALM
jgi:hypothetical protein